MKKNTKSKQNERRRRDDGEFSSLNSSLGNFGLEPPKRYRPEQREEKRETVKKPNIRSRKREEPSFRNLDDIRREENRNRKNAKLKRKILFYSGLVISITALIVILSLTVFFKINTITVEGNKKYSVKEITAVLPISKGTNLFICDTEKAAQKLSENLPYIYDAQITRKLPGTIKVKVTETPRIYSIKNKDSTYTLLDGKFKVLETSAKKNKNCVQINNTSLKNAIVGMKAEFSDTNIENNLIELSEAIERLELDDATAIYSTDINNNYIVFDKRITVKLGTLEGLDDKIYSALTAIEKLNESNPQAEGTITVTNDKQIYFSEK